MHLLLVGAGQQLSDVIERNLSKEGFVVDLAPVVDDAAKCLAKHRFDAVIVNLAARDETGQTLIRQLRNLNDTMPIMALTSHNADERVESLQNGADDCLSRPFVVSELKAHIHALLRRFNTKEHERKLRVGDLELDPVCKEIQIGDRFHLLSAREAAVLGLLLRHPNRVVAKRRLEMHLYGLCTDNSQNALDVCVHRLRKRLLDVGANVTIETVRGTGYILRHTEEI